MATEKWVGTAAMTQLVNNHIGKTDISSIGDGKITGAIKRIAPTKITQAEYDALSDAQKKAGVYLITDADNNVASGIKNVTQAEYNALTTAQKNADILYNITDAVQLDHKASSISYTNTGTSVAATNVQAAITELDSEATSLSNYAHNTTASAYSASTSYAVGAYCTYNNKLWKCLVAAKGVTPTEGATWTATDIGTTLTTINSNLSMNNMQLNLDVPLVDGWSYEEYFRYSKYGKLVIVDVGGARHAVGSAQVVSNGLPVMRTRPVVCGETDSSPYATNAIFYGELNTSTLMAHVGTTNRIFAQIIYITD